MSESYNSYRYPLPQFMGLECGRLLADGIPESYLYQEGPFLASRSPNSHTGPFQWAIDFLVPDGTAVLAAARGVVVDARDTWNVWGADESFRDKLNFVTIEHEHKEYSQYCHLLQYSFRQSGLCVGDEVEEGRILGVVGKTGWTDRDHLHFMVFRQDQTNPEGFYSVRPNFRTTEQ